MEWNRVACCCYNSLYTLSFQVFCEPVKNRKLLNNFYSVQSKRAFTIWMIFMVFLVAELLIVMT